MRRLGAVLVAAGAASACLSSAELSGGVDGARDGGAAETGGGVDAGGTVPTDDASGATCAADLQSDIGNCGACGRVCPNRVNAYGVCNGGACEIACNTAFADCDGKAETGCEVSLDNDTNHCGACGRSCAGGACRGGVCQPRTIATLQGSFSGLAVDGDDLYVSLYTNPTYSIVRMSTEGAGIRDLATGLTRSPGSLAVDATHVYFTRTYTSVAASDGAVFRVPRSGNGEATSLATGELLNVGKVRVDGRYAYYAIASRRVSAQEVVPGKLRRVPIDGSDEASDVMDVAHSTTDFVLDGPNVYATCAGDSIAATPPATGSSVVGRGVFRCAAAGCGATPTKLLTPESLYFYNATANASSIFLAGGVIGKLAKASGEYAFFSPLRFGNPSAIAADEARVYWLDGYDLYTVFSCPITGCAGAPDEILLPGYGSTLILTKDAIYVASSVSSTSIIQRIAR
ncbi:MAG: hypothetical protein KIT84_25525 [Labilithrix sp.]|nr:hypothetical protein [Labilithrix sp.]MCW5814413.1 hypothetical protein [Labilithrix sp.]